MRKMHNCIVSRKEIEQTAINKYITLLTDILKTLWLKHSVTQSSFFDNSLTDIIVNTHYIINCQLSVKFNELMNTSLMFITDQLKRKHAAVREKWVAKGCLKQELSINVNNWMMKVQ